MNELGAGFLEAVYKNALFLALKQKEIFVEVEKSFEVYFREQKIGLYKADLVAQGTAIIELKCCAVNVCFRNIKPKLSIILRLLTCPWDC